MTKIVKLTRKEVEVVNGGYDWDDNFSFARRKPKGIPQPGPKNPEPFPQPGPKNPEPYPEPGPKNPEPGFYAW